jgi:hypothetical protein
LAGEGVLGRTQQAFTRAAALAQNPRASAAEANPATLARNTWTPPTIAGSTEPASGGAISECRAASSRWAPSAVGLAAT